MGAFAQMDFSIATQVEARLERLLTRHGRERAGEASLPEWARALDDGCLLADVLGALELDGAPRRRLPLAAVLPLGETAGETRAGWGATRQRITLTVGVVAMIRAPNDPGGTRVRGRDALSGALTALRAALIGWTPQALLASPVTFARARLLEVGEGRITWQDEYVASYSISAHDAVAPCDPPARAVRVTGHIAPDPAHLGAR